VCFAVNPRAEKCLEIPSRTEEGRKGWLQGKTNFFEKRVGEYQKAGVMSSGNAEEVKGFSLDADF